MKLFCDHCGTASSPSAIRLEGNDVVMTCAHCGRDSTATATERDEATATDANEGDGGGATAEVDGATGDAAASAEGELASEGDEDGAGERGSSAPPPAERDAEPVVKCPRCFHHQATVEPCHRCGLDLSRDELHALTVADWDDVPDGKQEAHARAREMWTRIEASPDDDALHAAFVEHCTEHRLLTFAVRRYREYLSEHPANDTLMSHRDRAVHKLETMAMTMLTADRWSEGVARRVATAKRVLTILAILLLIAGLVLLIFVFKEKGTLSPTAF